MQWLLLEERLCLRCDFGALKLDHAGDGGGLRHHLVEPEWWTRLRLGSQALRCNNHCNRHGGARRTWLENLLESLTQEGGEQRLNQRNGRMGKATSVRVPEGHDGK